MKKDKKERKQRKKPVKFFAFLRAVERTLYRLFFPYTSHGNLGKYNQGGLIIIGNHYSVLDVVYPIKLTDRPIRFIAKEELWRGGPLTKWFVKKCECIPAKRDGSDVQTIKTCLQALKAGEVINIFPEGTRNRSYDDFLPFFGGAAALSIKTRTPIVPVVLVSKVRLFHRIHVVYGDPVEFRAYYGKKVTKEQLEECDEILRQAMLNMRKNCINKYSIKVKSGKI